MSSTLRTQVLDRDGLTTGLADIGRLSLRATLLADLQSVRIPSRGGILATWQNEDFDPYPEALIVRDEDYEDTLAWLGSYFNGLAPITQWCRIWSQSAVGDLSAYRAAPTLGPALGSWVGMVIAEIALLGGPTVSLRDVPGTAALTSASFAGARAVAVWDHKANLHDVAQKHDELSLRLRDGTRLVSASRLLPIWYTLAGDRLWLGAEGERRSLQPFSDLFDHIGKRLGRDDLIQFAINEATDEFDLPLIAECGRGPQAERVQALDRLAAQLTAGPQTLAVTALLGFSASLVEPGVAVLPELLRKYTATMPLAPIWLGAFAGAWSPARVLAEHQGLGRMISKAMLSEVDLEGRPICDIAFPELKRWIGGSANPRLSLRGMAARTLNVEVVPGVTAPFALGGRLESSRTETTAPAPASYQAPSSSNRGRPSASSAATGPNSLQALVTELVRRVERLERTNFGGAVQPDLLTEATRNHSEPDPSKKAPRGGRRR